MELLHLPRLLLRQLQPLLFQSQNQLLLPP